MAECTVYAIGQRDGLKKLGIATRVSHRRNGIQVGAPFEVAVLAARVMPSAQHAFAVEQMCHQDLDEHWIYGEWFKAPLSVVEDVISRSVCRVMEVGEGFDGSGKSRDALWLFVCDVLGLAKRAMVTKRVRAGLDAAKARGRSGGGRVSKFTDEQIFALEPLGMTKAMQASCMSKSGWLRRLRAAKLRAAIPLGTTKGAAKVKLSVSSFIRRRRLIEGAESNG